jgi:hypothetical protein
LELLQPYPLSHHSLAYLQPCLFQKEGIPVCYVISYPALQEFMNNEIAGSTEEGKDD